MAFEEWISSTEIKEPEELWFECCNCGSEWRENELNEDWDVDPTDQTTIPNMRIKLCPECGGTKFFINIIQK